jgi:hypothetical protein
MPCFVCRDSHHVYQGAVVTITDLDQRVVHLNWPLPDVTAPAPRVATQPGGKPVHQLPDTYQLRHHASLFGVRPEDLTVLDGGDPIRETLTDAIVTLDHPTADPVAQHLAGITRGAPGGRLLIAAVAPQAPPITHLIRLAAGLGLALDLTMVDYRLNAHDLHLMRGQRWNIEMPTPDAPIDHRRHPFEPSPEAAAENLLRYLENAIIDAVPTDPEQPIPVPQQRAPSSFVDDPLPLIRRLGHHHAGQPVTVRFERARCHVYVCEHDVARYLASAPTLAAALAALGLTSH